MVKTQNSGLGDWGSNHGLGSNIPTPLLPSTQLGISVCSLVFPMRWNSDPRQSRYMICTQNTPQQPNILFKISFHGKH